MHRICNTLQSQGYQVTFIGRTKKSSAKLYDQKFSQHRFSMLFESGMLFYLEYQIRLFLYLFFASKPQLIYSVDLDTVIPVKCAGWLRKSLTIHDAHELFTEVPELKNAPFKRWIWMTVGKFTVKNFDLRFTVNESLSKILKKTYVSEFIVLRNLPNKKAHSTNKVDFERPYIWYQGVLNKGRGLEVIIDAMAALSDLDLRIAGEGDLSSQLRLQAEKSDAKDRIFFHGWMDSDSLHGWASRAWLGINLLDNSSGNYYHSLANRTFDYIQAELPSIHMDFPEYRSVLDKYKVGELLKDLNLEALVMVISGLQNDTNRYNHLRKECMRAKQEYVWEAESFKLINSIKALS